MKYEGWKIKDKIREFQKELYFNTNVSHKDLEYFLNELDEEYVILNKTKLKKYINTAYDIELSSLTGLPHFDAKLNMCETQVFQKKDLDHYELSKIVEVLKDKFIEELERALG